VRHEVTRATPSDVSTAARADIRPPPGAEVDDAGGTSTIETGSVVRRSAPASGSRIVKV
jgi:hypothetical protein